MTSYSFNQERKDVVFASVKDVNASYKDLCAVCDAIRYKSTDDALHILDGVIKLEMPVKFRRNNKYMGSRHELGGNKGRWPRKCAMIVKKLLNNALASAKSKGVDSFGMYVVHSSANKQMVVRRTPSKGTIAFGLGRYGPGSTRFSDLEFAKIELGIASDYDKLSKKIRRKVGHAAKKQSSKPAANKPVVLIKNEKSSVPVAEPAKDKGALATKPAKQSTAVTAANTSKGV
jgi:large subunit ribosomal protein L22